jgi:hypothetical protein
MSSVVLGFDGFGHESLAAEAAGRGACFAELLQAAVRHYLSQLEGDRFSLRVPAFARSARRSPPMSVGVALDECDLAALSSEAERQGLAVEELLGHAALFYLADQDAGRPASSA